MIVTGFDVETTGLSHLTHRVVKVGAVLWDTDLKNPIEMFDCLVWDSSYPEIEAAAQEAHKISKQLLIKHGKQPKEVFNMLNTLLLLSEAVVAHNGTHLEGKVIVECDSRKHRTTAVKEMDKIRDKYFKKLGWKTIRVKEPNYYGPRDPR